MKLLHNYLFFVAILFAVLSVSNSLLFEAIGIGIFSALGYKYKDIKRLTYCKLAECCTEDQVPYNINSLRINFDSNLFGQHIVKDKVYNAVNSHYNSIKYSKKPLVMSFHGTPGIGKNFVADMIAEAVFEKGASSSFYHKFHGSMDFPGIESVGHYKEKLVSLIKAAVKKCPYSIFLFDEVDKMPKGVLDVITAMLDHHTSVQGLDFRKTVFIFLTNDGGKNIIDILTGLVNKNGLFREEVKLHHFESAMSLGLYNSEGGLQNSKTIEHAVIDFYIPFLPLEMKHVEQCIKAEFKHHGWSSVGDDLVKEVMEYIAFDKTEWYSLNGCKTITKKVQSRL
ncbi:unnamed protein product [Diamesa serratosioi]